MLIKLRQQKSELPESVTAAKSDTLEGLMADTALLLFRLASVLHRKYSTELLMTNLLIYQGVSLILMTF